MNPYDLFSESHQPKSMMQHSGDENELMANSPLNHVEKQAGKQQPRSAIGLLNTGGIADISENTEKKISNEKQRSGNIPTCEPKPTYKSFGQYNLDLGSMHGQTT